MPQLTQADLNYLRSIANKAGTYTPADAVAYYTYLSSKGFKYGDLSLGVVKNNTLSGQLANGYAKEVAEEKGVDMSVGSPAWLSMQQELIKQDIVARVGTHGNDLSVGDYITIHDSAASISSGGVLDGTIFTPAIPLNNLKNTGQNLLAQTLWDDIVNNDTLPNMIGQGVWLDNAAGGAGLWAWQRNLAEAAYDNIPLWLQQNQKNLYDFLAQLEQKFGQISNDYGWALNNPGALLGGLHGLLPDWLSGPLGILDGAPGVNPARSGGGSGGGDPLVLDINGDGQINLTSIDNGVYNDFLKDGFKEKRGWVAPGDGILTIDLDKNGLIEGTQEMFSSKSPLSYLMAGGPENYTTQNGFIYLGKYDLNADGVIDSKDTVFTELRVWQDLNQNGVSDVGELKTLSELNIKSIDVAGAQLDHFAGILSGGFLRQIAGNTITHSSTFTMNDGTTREIVDAWLNDDVLNTQYTGSYTLNPKVLFLPTLKGFGNITDLHVAMSKDATLLSMMESFFTKRNFTQLFSDYNALTSEVRDMLFQWAGVPKNPTPTLQEQGNSGLFSLMPEYLFLKKFTGTSDSAMGMWFDERPFAPIPYDGIKAVTDAFNLILQNYTAQLIYQVGGNVMFDVGSALDPFSSSFSGVLNLSQSAITQIQTAAAGVSNKEAYWNNFAKIVDATKGIANLTATEISAVDNAIKSSTANAFDWTKIEATLHHQITVLPNNYTPIVNGTQWDDVITGYNYYYQATSPLKMSGGAGDDIIYGNQGDDWISGGAGNDFLQGSDGNDTYYYESGNDVIYDTTVQGVGGSSPINTIEFSPGISKSDLTFKVFGMEDPRVQQSYIDVKGRGTIVLMADGRAPINLVDQYKFLKFSDGTIITLASLDVQILGADKDDTLNSYTLNGMTGIKTLYGYDGNDTIYGDWGAARNEIIIGGKGNDVLSGIGGDDTYVYESGNDIIYEGLSEGNDKIIFAAGITPSSISIETV